MIAIPDTKIVHEATDPATISLDLKSSIRDGAKGTYELIQGDMYFGNTRICKVAGIFTNGKFGRYAKLKHADDKDYKNHTELGSVSVYKNISKKTKKPFETLSGTIKFALDVGEGLLIYSIPVSGFVNRIQGSEGFEANIKFNDFLVNKDQENKYLIAEFVPYQK